MEIDMDDKVHIQAQDRDGIWRTYHTTFNESIRILNEMKSLKDRYPHMRVRAVDKNNRIVDFYG
jgi:hypothetical protein